MSSDHIPAKLATFVSNFFSSIEQLEVLLLLKNSPDKAFSAVEMNSILRSNEDSVRSRLLKLAEQGALVKNRDPETFRYSPANAELDELLHSVAEAYITHRFSIINLIYSGELRTIETFADAFNMRKGKKDG